MKPVTVRMESTHGECGLSSAVECKMDQVIAEVVQNLTQYAYSGSLCIIDQTAAGPAFPGDVINYVVIAVFL